MVQGPGAPIPSQRSVMKLATASIFAAAIGILSSAAALAGERTTFQTWYTYGACNAGCGESHSRAVAHRRKSHRVTVRHSLRSHYYGYEGEPEIAEGGYAMPVPPAPVPMAPDVPARRFVYPVSAPAAPVFNFFGPTNNFFGPVSGFPLPPDAGGGDNRLDPWHGYDPNNGLENGY
jgi:hypothetical protein